MQDLPHHYRVTAQSTESGSVSLHSEGVEVLASAPPKEFGGPGDLWSPETLLVGAVADCFVLTFRAVARASKLEWISLDCHVDGLLDRVEKETRFTSMALIVTLRVPDGASASKAERLLHKAEAGCLITNSLSCDVSLVCTVEGDS